MACRDGGSVSVDRLLKEAAAQNASHVYLTPGVEPPVALRVAGELVIPVVDLAETLSAHIARAKQLAALDPDDSAVPQWGHFEFRVAGQTWGATVSTLPTSAGDAVAVELHPPRDATPTLADLGVHPATIEALQSALSTRPGVLLIAGLWADVAAGLDAVCRLEIWNGRRVAFLSRSGRMGPEGVLRIGPSGQADMANMLRAALDHDFTAFAVSDVMDAETAGHLFSEAHPSPWTTFVAGLPGVRDAAEVPQRLLNLRVSLTELEGRLMGILGLRLARLLCRSCRETRPPTAAEQAALGETAGTLTAVCDAPGCAECARTGHDGEIVLAEWIPATDAVCDAFGRGPEAVRGAALPAGAGGLRDSGLALVGDGAITVREWERVLTS